MAQHQRLRGDRSLLSTVFGRFAPASPRTTESVKIAEKLDRALTHPRVDKRTDKVYGLWDRAGRRYEEKAEESATAARTMDDLQLDIQHLDRRYALMTGGLVLLVIGVLVWLLPQI